MLEPFLKWPGGKRWLFQRFPQFFPARFDRYIEPFVGGGAVFFGLTPRKAILTDANAELINAYRCIRENATTLERGLSRLHRSHGTDQYYRMRASAPRSATGRALRFLYLNRTCFNGMYRENGQGRFNVPIGTKTAVRYAPGYLREVASLLRGKRIARADFEATLLNAGRGDFVFLDPPYTVMHNTNNFIKYNARLFSWADQIRLAKAVRACARRGAVVTLTNANHESVRELYHGFGEHIAVSRLTRLAPIDSARVATTELIVTTAL